MTNRKNIYVKIRDFLTEPAQDKALLIQATCLLLFSHFALKLVPFRFFSSWLGAPVAIHTRISPSPPSEQIIKIARSVRRANYHLPFEVKCLPQAMTAHKMLRTRKIESVLCFGVKHGEDTGSAPPLTEKSFASPFKAHAWVEVHSTPVIGGEIIDQFTKISSFK
ncbi:lasso peptide biosynthesis B2 protein [Terasakiella pusilla]|uniref:lasso peptide biosynthesis B2 protein n=1 Tax=Terasakiella pusilla TaxID=64973 RepID=UPI003AA91280